MSARYVDIQEERKRLLGGSSADARFEAGNERQESLAACFRDELIFGSKMTIEAPVSKSRSSHHSRERRLGDSIGCELGACRFDNSLACLGGFHFGLTHSSLSPIVQFAHAAGCAPGRLAPYGRTHVEPG